MSFDAVVKLIDVVCAVLRAILHTDYIKRFSITPLKVGRLPRKLLAVDRHRLLELLATVGRVPLKGSTDLHPGELVGLRIAAHLPHHIIHVDLSLRTLTVRHSFNSSLQAALSGRQRFFLDQVSIVLIDVRKGRVPYSRHEQEKNGQVAPRVSVAGDAVEFGLELRLPFLLFLCRSWHFCRFLL